MKRLIFTEILWSPSLLPAPRPSVPDPPDGGVWCPIMRKVLISTCACWLGLFVSRVRPVTGMPKGVLAPCFANEVGALHMLSGHGLAACPSSTSTARSGTTVGQKTRNTGSPLLHASKGPNDAEKLIGWKQRFRSRPPSMSMSIRGGGKVELAESATEDLRLSVRGMRCGGCSSRVTRILKESQGVEAAVVSLPSSMAIVKYFPAVLNPSSLVKVLNKNGFSAEVWNDEDAVQRVARQEDADREEGKDLLRSLIIICVICIPTLMNPASMIGIPPVLGVSSDVMIGLAQASVALCTAGMRFIRSGWDAVRAGYANMDVLVTMGVGSAYAHSLAMLWVDPTHAMFQTVPTLLAIILFGRFLEFNARRFTTTAITDIAALQPQRAMLVLGSADAPETVEVDVRVVQPGDKVKVVAGSMVPVDGEVVEGGGLVDESMMTGEPYPVYKQPGCSVLAGTRLGNRGGLCVRASRTGAATAVAEMLELVQTAHADKAPVAHLADTVAAVLVPAVTVLAAAVTAGWMLAGMQGWVGTSYFGAGVGPVTQVHVPDHVRGVLTMPASAAWALPHASPLLLLVVKREAARLLTGGEQAVLFGVSTLVVCCPCAMAIATPIAMVVGIGVGARHGVLFKSAGALQSAASVTHMCFDKTGTLTEGKAKVVDAVVFPPRESACGEGEHAGQRAREGRAAGGGAGVDEGEVELWKALVAVESNSQHPLASVIAAYAKERIGEGTRDAVPTCPRAHDVELVEGMGVACRIEGRRVVVGSKELMDKYLGDEERRRMRVGEEWEAKGRTAVWVGIEEAGPPGGGEGVVRCRLGLGVEDPIRVETKAVVEGLKKGGVEVLMLSGDSQRTAEVVAAAVGIEEARGSLHPAAKVQAIAELQRRGGTVGMVGDGVNDAAALAQADVGVAIGAGSAVATRGAAVVLGRLAHLLTASSLAKATLTRVRLSLLWAGAYNLVSLPLAAGLLAGPLGLVASPCACAGLMSASSLFVVLSALSLSLFRPPPLAIPPRPPSPPRGEASAQ